MRLANHPLLRRVLGPPYRRLKQLLDARGGAVPLPALGADSGLESVGEQTTSAERGVLDLFEKHVKSQPLDEYHRVHITRFNHTLERCGAILQGSQRLLELGGHSMIGTFTRDVLGASLTEYSDDLRFPF